MISSPWLAEMNITVVHIDAYMLTLRLQLLEVFRLHVMPRHVFEIK